MTTPNDKIDPDIRDRMQQGNHILHALANLDPNHYDVIDWFFAIRSHRLGEVVANPNPDGAYAQIGRAIASLTPAHRDAALADAEEFLNTNAHDFPTPKASDLYV